MIGGKSHFLVCTISSGRESITGSVAWVFGSGKVDWLRIADCNRLRLMDGYVDWNWNGQWKRKELWRQKFGNEGSFDEFSDNSLLLGRFRGVEEERGCQKDGKDDGEDSHGGL